MLPKSNLTITMVHLLSLIAFALSVPPLYGLPGARAGGTAHPDSTIHLEDLILLVRAQNPTLHAAELQAESMSFREQQASALPYPTFGVSYQPLPIHTARGTQRSQWRIEQAIPFPGKTGLRGDVARLTATRAYSDAERVQLDLVLDLESSYSQAYHLQEELGLMDEFAADLDRFKEAAAVEYELGRGHQQAVLRAQLERTSLEIRSIRLQTDLRSALERLALLTNDLGLPSRAARLAPPSLLTDSDASDPLDVVLQRRPDVQSLETTRTLADARQRLAGKESLPDFAVHVAYFDIAAKAPPTGADGRDALAVGASVRIPLWGGERKGRRGEAQLEMKRAESELEALRSAVETEIRDLRQQVAGETRRIELLQGTLIPQAETTLEATLAGYTNGNVGFLDLLDAERMLFELRSEENSARRRLNVSMARLRHAAAAQ